MADENSAAVAEPPASAPEGDGPLTISLGEITDAMDKAFPSTAPKPGATIAPPEPAPSAPPVQPPTPPEAPPTAPAAPVEGEVPDSVFGDQVQKADEKPVVEPQVDVPPSIKEPKAIENWKQLRTAYDETKATVAKQTTEITELRKKADLGVADEALKARLAVVEQQNKELTDRVRSVDIQQDEGFQQHFVAGRQQLVSTASSIAKRAGIDPGVVENALSLSGDAKIQALDEITESIASPTLKTQLSNVAGQIDNLDQQKAAVLADSKGSFERLQEQRKAESYRQMQEQEKTMNSLFDGAVDYLSKQGWEVYKEVEGEPDHFWNKQKVELVGMGRDFLLKTTDQNQIALMPAMAAAAPVYRGLFLKTRALLKERDKRIAELEGAEPSLNGRQRADATDADALPANMSFAEAAARGSGLR